MDAMLADPTDPKLAGLAADLLRLLEKLGDTDTKVAGALGRLKVKGRRQSAEHDALGNYLRHLLTEAAYIVHDVSVVAERTWMRLSTKKDHKKRNLFLDHPDAVTEFCYAFDDGQFPELEE
jgi:hypothetical protein